MDEAKTKSQNLRTTSNLNTNTIQQPTMNRDLKKKFQNFGYKQRIKQLRQNLLEFYGKNFPNSYESNCKFQEQWQNRNNIQFQRQNNILQESNILQIVYHTLLMILHVFTIWIITVQNIFETGAISQNISIHPFMLCITIFDLIVKIYSKYNHQGSQITVVGIVSLFYKNFYLIFYLTIMIINGPNRTLYKNNYNLFFIIQSITVKILYNSASKTYQSLKIMQFSLKYQYQIKITDLLFNVFIQAHIFALVLFSASKIDRTQNWVLTKGLDNSSIFQKYFNSFYFASTTMLTIGYGDTVPISTGEKIVTIFIQIIGVVSFGYLLNQMGHTLSKIRFQSEVLEKDLQTISKISKYYNLQKCLQVKAKNFVINNQRKNQDLKEQDEQRFMMKLNDDLRQQINLQNSLTVVKSSIFFLCHWSKNLQSQIASRLQKRIFSPNQNLIWGGKKDRVYIIKKGKIDIMMNRYGGTQHRKLLKIIDTQKAKTQVLDNIYNYTTVFSNRVVRLEAIAKQFTSTYSVSKQQFHQCIRKQSTDFQYYHEIKCRIDQSTFCQEWETPFIKNSQQHYSPSKMFIIRRHRRIQTHSINKRKFCKRFSIKRFQLFAGYRNINQRRSSYSASNQNVPLAQKTIQLFKYKNQDISEKTIQQKTNEQINIQNVFSSQQSSEVNQTYENRQLSHKLALFKMRTGKITRSFQQNKNKMPIVSSFQYKKQYRFFFKFNNFEYVLKRYEKQNPLQQNNCIINLKKSKKLQLNKKTKLFKQF